MDIVEHLVYNKFQQASANAPPMHDSDIEWWALERAKERSLENFTASKHWLIDFKNRHQIASRRITKFVTKHEMEDTAEIQKSAHDFVFQARKEMKKFKLNKILDTDQSEIQLEIHSNRTLSFKGEHVTLSRIM